MPNSVKLSIIIVSYNTKSILKNCLKSVIAEQNASAFAIQIIVVDNASTDKSAALVKTKFPQVKLISNSQNLGYAQANNLGIKKASGEYILLLNSDTRLKPHSLTHLIEFMDSNPQVGIASPKLLNPDHTIQPQGGALPGLFKIILWAFLIDDLPLLDRLILPYHQNYPQFFTQTRPLGWVAGTAMCLRRSLLDEIGLLDEKIFMYSEDTDLCLRAQSHGHSVYNVSSSQVIHLGHASGSNTQAILGEFRGLIYLYRKHYPAWQLPLLRLILKFAVLLRLFLFGTIFRQPHKYDTYQKALKIS